MNEEPMPNNYKQLVLRALQKMAERDDIFQNSHGNVSVLDREKGLVYIKPSGVPFHEFYLEDQICVVDLKTGDLVEGRLKPSVDTKHHINVYANHPKINSIVHSHTPFVVAWASLGRDIKCYFTEQADFFGGTIYCLEYSDYHTWGEKIELQIGEKAVLLAKHGSIVVEYDEDPDKCVETAVVLEDVAHKAYLSKMLGMSFLEQVQEMNMNEVKSWSQRFEYSYGQDGKK
jgi:L-ribulose-5-phosphate 4-epimerase